MAKPPVPDAVSKAFADLTGLLEAAAQIAARGQSVRWRGEAGRCQEELSATPERLRIRLRYIDGQLR